MPTRAKALPLDCARKRLADRVADMRVGLIPGLRDDLKAIDAALADVDGRTRLLARCVVVLLTESSTAHTFLPKDTMTSLGEFHS